MSRSMPNDSSKTCPTCGGDGHGTRKYGKDEHYDCPDCNGTGTQPTRCSFCGATGHKQLTCPVKRGWPKHDPVEPKEAIEPKTCKCQCHGYMNEKGYCEHCDDFWPKKGAGHDCAEIDSKEAKPAPIVQFCKLNENEPKPANGQWFKVSPPGLYAYDFVEATALSPVCTCGSTSGGYVIHKKNCPMLALSDQQTYDKGFMDGSEHGLKCVRAGGHDDVGLLPNTSTEGSTKYGLSDHQDTMTHRHNFREYKACPDCNPKRGDSNVNGSVRPSAKLNLDDVNSVEGRVAEQQPLTKSTDHNFDECAIHPDNCIYHQLQHIQSRIKELGAE